MDDLGEHDYYLFRQQQERALADAAISPFVASLHRDLAARYGQLVHRTAFPRDRLLSLVVDN